MSKQSYLDDYQCNELLELKEDLRKLYFPQLARKYPQIETAIAELSKITCLALETEFNNPGTPWITYTTRKGTLKYKWDKSYKVEKECNK